MKKFETLIILVMVSVGAAMLYQKLDSMGPEFEPQSSPPAQTETATTETKPVATETPAPAQPAPATTAPVAAETPATTPAAPATPPTPPPSPEPAAQPVAPATPMPGQPAAAPATPPAPVQSAAPATAAPATPATPTPSQPTQPTPTVPPAPAATTPPPMPAAPPVQVATPTPPSAPVAPAEPQKKLTELTPDDLMARLPVQARTSYRMAHSLAESRGDMIGMRSWFVQWRRYLADPMRAMLELDMAKLLIQSKASYPNEAAAKSARRGNANEARMLVNGIISRRVNNAELAELVEKAKQDVDRELEQVK